ncbi:VIR protein [Plasmodium vivax]|uniref:VIR protein n=1 Tax=Plasmodium vivax TaxID=5855 RepID=A0A1G4ECD1_PLAVI|nr:VIR protein [Plasmodium vivax]
MADCQRGPSDTYLEYKCYDYLKPRFDTINVSEIFMDYLRQAVAILDKSYSIPPTYEEIFKEITSHVSKGDIFIKANTRLPCNYINYLLNKKMRNNGMHKNDTIYNIFKKFVREVYIKDRGNYHDKLACDIDIKPLDENIYDKMTKLYELYNLYNVLKKNRSGIINNECLSFREMIGIYNNTIKDLTLQDEELVNKLLTLKEMTSNIPLPESKICYDRIEHFKEPKLYNDLKEKERLRKEQEEAQKAIEKQKQEAQRREQQQQQQQLQAAQNLLLEPVTGGTLRIPENNPLLGTPREQLKEESLNPASLRGQDNSEEPPLRYPSTPLLVNSMEQTEFYQPGEKYHETEDDQIAQSYTPGVLGSLKNTITGVLGEVDLVPVVGVSGGMGALFLLFRYTPVGTFFRGRGYRQRIPTRFDGVYPGFMTEFQGYGDGYFPHDRINITYGPE